MSDYTSWHVGMKVVCIDAHGLSNFEPLVEDQTYTVRAFNVCSFTGSVGIYVEGIVNQGHPITGVEFAYLVSRFRRVVTRKTDISIFERIRDNPKAPIIEPSPKQRERV